MLAKLSKAALAPVDWMGSAKNDVTRFPQEIKNEFGQSLLAAQLGQLADNAKPMKGELREVIEIVATDNDGTYRLLYTVTLGNRIYVLHAFQKKSTHGIATPKRETDMIKKRLQIARGRAAISSALSKTEASSSKGKKK